MTESPKFVSLADFFFVAIAFFVCLAVSNFLKTPQNDIRLTVMDKVQKN
jgi:hypothetical protein